MEPTTSMSINFPEAQNLEHNSKSESHGSGLHQSERAISSDQSSLSSIRSMLPSNFQFLSPKKRLPIINNVMDYSLNKFSRDLVAGLTVALTTVPYCIALSSISGLDPEYPLGASIIGNIVYAFLGTAKDLNIGSTAAVALLMKIYAVMGCPDYARFLTFYTGVIEILFGVLQMSSLVNYVSPTVLSAFISATSLTIIISQTKHFLGLTFDCSDRSIVKLFQIFKYIDSINWSDFSMGLFSLIILFALRFLATRKIWQQKNYDASFFRIFGLKVLGISSLMSNVIVLAIGILIVYVFGGEILNLTLVKSGLDSQILTKKQPLPFFVKDEIKNKTLSFDEMFHSSQFGLVTVPLLAMLFTIAVAKSFGRKNEYRIDVTQEFLAFGVANVAASFFKSFPIAASISRTAVNSHCNVATPLSGLFSSAFVVLIVMFASTSLKYIPESCLSAVIIASVIFSIDVQTVKRTLRVQKHDFAVILITILAALIFSPELALLLGIFSSLAFVLIPMSKPNPEIEEFRNGRLLIVRFDHGLNFPAAEALLDYFVEKWDYYNSDERFSAGKPSPKLCVVDLHNICQMDYSVFHGLATAKEYYESRGTFFYFIRAKPNLKKFFESISGDNLLLRLRVFESFEAAVDCYRKEKKSSTTKYASMSLKFSPGPGTAALMDSHEMASLCGSLYP